MPEFKVFLLKKYLVKHIIDTDTEEEAESIARNIENQLSCPPEEEDCLGYDLIKIEK
jgi:hypothetical protein